MTGRAVPIGARSTEVAPERLRTHAHETNIAPARALDVTEINLVSGGEVTTSHNHTRLDRSVPD